MTLQELKAETLITIENFKNHGDFPKENNRYDYKAALNFYGGVTDPTEIFMRNFCKDILSFSNSAGGIIILGVQEDKISGVMEEKGLDAKNLELLQKIDLNNVTQKFEKLAKVGVSLDLQAFQIGTRKLFYILIEKQHHVLIPINDTPDYKIKKGDIFYRASSKNETANNSTQDFNRFLQIKANEKNKEFMEIWSRLLPEMFDINPREILILNPKTNKIYGFNGKDKTLSSSDIDIDKTDQGVFNVILKAISAGEIGKISDDEGKPLYKIVGEVKSQAPRDSIPLSTLEVESKNKSKLIFSSVQLKQAMHYLKWVTDANFSVTHPDASSINPDFSDLIWIEVVDKIKGTEKVVFSDKAINPIVEVINNSTLHNEVFGRQLNSKKK